MSDKTLLCVTCGEEFVFTAGEQEFYAEKGFTEPKKCKPCRDAAKAARFKNQDGHSNNNRFNNDDNQAGRPNNNKFNNDDNQAA